MKSKIIMLLSLLLLTSCSNVDVQRDNSQIQNIIDNYLALEYTNNHSKKLFTYYVPSNVGVVEQTSTSSVFRLDNTQFLLTLNITNILSDEKSDIHSNISSDTVFYQSEGSFEKDDQQIDYLLRIIPISGQYYIDFESDNVSLYGYGSGSQLLEIVKAMTKVLKSVSINLDSIKAIYDKEDIIENTKQQLNLFNEVVPESGRLDELVDGDVVTPTLIPTTTDDSYKEDEIEETPVVTLDPDTNDNNDENSDSNVTESPSTDEDIYKEE